MADHNLELRRQIDELIAQGSAQSAALRLNELWRNECGPATAAFVVSRYEKLRESLPHPQFRVAILRSFTIEPIIPLLRAEAFSHGLDITVHIGDFNAYAQEILDLEGSLYRFRPDCVVLAVRTAEIAPELWRDSADLSAEQTRDVIRRAVSSFQNWIAAFRKSSQAALVVHDLELPVSPSAGILDAQLVSGQAFAIQEINRELGSLARSSRAVYILDYDSLVARYGRLAWQDERKWHTSRLPISASHLVHLAREWLCFIAPMAGKVAKVLAVDLDNTLWGGVIGEDGINGIHLGAEYPGAVYQALQRALIDLTRRGILLAICSKNNPEDAKEALEKHPGMLLRPEHFSAMRISWNDKAQGLREIAAELNVGIDSVAFLDDNPAEREQIRASLPEVIVIELPQDAFKYAAAVREHPALQRLALSSEDLQRTQAYAEQRERAKAEQSFQSKEDFFRFLEQEAWIEPVSPQTLARVAQLTQKTNQFNVTTRRYGEAEIAALAGQPNSQVLSIRVRDRFGDHGLVGVAITRDDGDNCEIDTFLLSCRVIGRSVESALLAHLAESAKSRGRTRLTGWFLPTKKNAPAKDFYAQHGFVLAKNNGTGSFWTFDLARSSIVAPDRIKLSVAKGERE
jgi:FkbH-like protein